MKRGKQSGLLPSSGFVSAQPGCRCTRRDQKVTVTVFEQVCVFVRQT